MWMPYRLHLCEEAALALRGEHRLDLVCGQARHGEAEHLEQLFLLRVGRHDVQAVLAHERPALGLGLGLGSGLGLAYLALAIRKIQPRHGEPPPGGPAWLGVGVRGEGLGVRGKG